MENYQALERISKADYNVQMLGLCLNSIISNNVEEKLKQEAIKSSLLISDEIFFNQEDVHLFKVIKANIEYLTPNINNAYYPDPDYTKNILLSQADDYLAQYDNTLQRQQMYKALEEHVNNVVEYAYKRFNAINVDHINRVKKALTDQYVAYKSQSALLDLENKQDNASGYLPNLMNQLSKVQNTAAAGIESKDFLMDHLDAIANTNDYGIPEVNIPFTFSFRMPNDMVSGGLKKRTFCIVAAPSHAGKTTWAIQQLIDILKANKKLYVTFYSVELQAEDLVLQIARAFCYQFQYQYYSREEFVSKYLRRNELSLEENALTDANAVKFFMFWLQQSGWYKYIRILGSDKVDSIETLEEDIANSIIIGKKPEVIFIDYLQALNAKPSDSKSELSAYQANSIISKKLSRLTKKYAIRCFALSQVRDPETGSYYCAENMPTATSVKDSRQYTQDADIIVTLCPYNEKKDKDFRLPDGLFTPTQLPDDEVRLVWVTIVKNRQGPISEHPFYFFNHKALGFLKRKLPNCLLNKNMKLPKETVVQRVVDEFRIKDK
ncbi:DnaB-like helicase C-terminal domain-containing protein [Psittacicella hinzii]|uniref:SF4 helicase domain-containing protein n=1 Tax=Psittacicella hinzii TaxID=2028575 RepID=A0A3A1YJ64_9GAMM|nr:DnaB-like helicase C-terminal domain-containing protein [Psittacicella hinzii]RIY37476.1 hypothetical protein CKF58_04970 [Psittacicella hinzii]